MSKGLEALKNVENELKFYYQDDWKITRYPKDITIIEKELKEYELLKQSKLLPYPQENGEEYRQDVVKRLMALEIIKEKRVDTTAIWYLAKNNYKKLSFYNDYLNKFKGELPLTQEEYDLLKEILL